MLRLSLKHLLYRRCPAPCNMRIVHGYLPALMYTAGATASAPGRALARLGRKPFLRNRCTAQQASVATMARGARPVIPEFTNLCTDVVLYHHAGHDAGQETRGDGAMQFGVMLPHRWLYAAGNTIADFAQFI